MSDALCRRRHSELARGAEMRDRRARISSHRIAYRGNCEARAAIDDLHTAAEPGWGRNMSLDES